MEFTANDLNKTLWVKPDYLEKNRKWYKIDAKGVTLGKLAVVIARKLSGKDKAHCCDFWDTGDFLVIENAKHIRITGNKLKDKIYYKHSGVKGNLKTISLGDLLTKNPERAIMYAVRGMLSKNKLRDRRMKRLKVFAETSNKFDYLHPEKIEING